RPAARPDRSRRRKNRGQDRPVPALLLPIRSQHWPIWPGHHARRPYRRRTHTFGARLIHFLRGETRKAEDSDRKSIMNGFRLFPERASTVSHQTDALYLFLCTVSAFFSILIFVLIVYFAVKYRRRSAVPPPIVHTDLRLELVWTIIPLMIVLFIFFWGARVFFYIYKPPSDSLDVHVIGKQWMWKIQHASGRREINELQLPSRQPVRLLLASKDLIAAVSIP